MAKAKELLGFEPQHTLADSMASIYDWVKVEGVVQEDLDKSSAYESGVEAGASGRAND